VTAARIADPRIEVWDYRRTMSEATLLVADNTSILPEFASTGRPVVWLDAKSWRIDVWHGGRFWDWPAGQVWVRDPADLDAAISAAVTDPPSVRSARRAMVESVYAVTDGTATVHAATAIRTMLNTC
jgi:asparagine N-glycosylation enzyme membrane subunit Stt3